MKLWVDDERPVPDLSWVLADGVHAAKTFIQNCGGDLEWVSLDYVLSPGDGTQVLYWMIENGYQPKRLTVHSSGGSANALLIAIAADAGWTATRYADTASMHEGTDDE